MEGGDIRTLQFMMPNLEQLTSKSKRAVHCPIISGRLPLNPLFASHTDKALLQFPTKLGMVPEKPLPSISNCFKAVHCERVPGNVPVNELLNI